MFAVSSLRQLVSQVDGTCDTVSHFRGLGPLEFSKINVLSSSLTAYRVVRAEYLAKNVSIMVSESETQTIQGTGSAIIGSLLCLGRS